jgi:hypothetical protein
MSCYYFQGYHSYSTIPILTNRHLQVLYVTGETITRNARHELVKNIYKRNLNWIAVVRTYITYTIMLFYYISSLQQTIKISESLLALRFNIYMLFNAKCCRFECPYYLIMIIVFFRYNCTLSHNIVKSRTNVISRCNWAYKKVKTVIVLENECEEKCNE